MALLRTRDILDPGRSRRYAVWFVSGILTINLGIAAFAWTTLAQSRRQYEERAEQTTQNLALALERELGGMIRTSDLLLRATIDEYQRQQRQGPVDPTALEDYIRRQLRRYPAAEDIRLTDAAGIVRYGINVRPEQRIDVSDRPHFRELIDAPSDVLVFSKPQQSRANGKWVMVLGRRMQTPDGRFDGMAFVPITVDTLTQTFSQIELPEGSSITLRRNDMTIVARHPPPPDGSSVVGQSQVAPEFSALLATGMPHGTFRAATPLDGRERVLSYRKLGEYPLYVIVGLAKSEYLAPWQTARTRAIIALTILFGLTITLALLVSRAWRRLSETTRTLEEIARTDFLTRLMNRRAFVEIAENEVHRARRFGKPLTLLMIDIDHFKQINDAHGHEVGDRALSTFADLLRDSVRQIDVLGRWGGEEFIVLLPETDAEHAYEVADRIRAAVAAEPLRADPPVRLTVSIGIAAIEAATPDNSFMALVARADEALYDAKHSGRNRICRRAAAARATTTPA